MEISKCTMKMFEVIVFHGTGEERGVDVYHEKICERASHGKKRRSGLNVP